MFGKLGELSWSAKAMLTMHSAIGMIEDVIGTDTAMRACWYQPNWLILAWGGGVGCGCSSMSS